MGSKPKYVAQPNPVYAAKPRAVENTQAVENQGKNSANRRNYGIDDTFIRAFAQAVGQGAATLGS